MDDKERKYLMTRRQCLIMELGAIEDMLDMERSIVPKRKRAESVFLNQFVDCIAPVPAHVEILGTNK